MNKINPKSVKVGDVMRIVSWVKVTGRSPWGGIDVQDIDDSRTYGIRGDSLIEKCESADAATEQMAVTQTELCDRLIAAKNIPFTVTFNKKNGTPRKLRGRLICPTVFGYSMVQDLDKISSSDDGIRQVDHRTIQSLIVDNVLYVLK